ncbi:MAG: class I SAM-dependent RNA methyltransferase [Anaeromicrobium sp.]|jgi:putative N6-adenine-specific DNA methylase|uniref:THUMP domain-containing class I SAM-dependent RNA methyltransferase n=1 Tax=Anaeromicrobium sp. TaxID=1929132 RepID=UPI0025CFD9E7|nr:class I SAM-dependent RNA methyltransferase [Anaeromicrobium sp.]MCT4594388.1 class I SAM-dependent RNA methyltransferase [Anaeromicrobium sp.]
MELTLIATATFGLEKLVKIEVENLGYEVTKVDNGKVEFKAEERDIPILNMWLRIADRVLVKMGEFKATTFEELFQGVKKLPWHEWIGENDKFPVNGKSVKSTLFSISDCQAITKKAIVEKLKAQYKVDWFKETGAEYGIEVALLKDVATITIDTSGVGLHKRGYRETANEAPLKETLAAAMVMISRWRGDRALIDPLCGSGTIAIEAAMIGKNIAPGLQRSFISENWSRIPKQAWKDARTHALKSIRQDVELDIYASDIDPRTIKIAKDNAYNAGVDECIKFEAHDMGKIHSNKEYGYIITNPPYGERLGEKAEVQRLYKRMGKVFDRFKTWSKYVITSDEELEKLYGKKADKKRKLFNGRIKVDYYQFFGPKPPKEYFNK